MPLFEQCFFIASIGFAVVQAVLAYLCFRSPKKWSSLLGISALAAMVTLVSYLGSISVQDYGISSLLSSLYFAGIDLMLFGFLHYVMGSINVLADQSCPFPGKRARSKKKKVDCPNKCGKAQQNHEDPDCADCAVISKKKEMGFAQKTGESIIRVLTLLGAIDLASLLSNPLTDLTISYTFDATHYLGHWVYVPHELYYFHLAYTYAMVVLTCGMLAYKIATTPSSYHGRYIPTLLMILVIVAVNFAFLFLHVFYLDVSVLFYAFAFLFVYWINFHYKDRALQKRTQDMILNALGHPVVFFDNEQNFCMSNEDAAFLTEGAGTEFTLDDFVTANDLQSPLPPCKRSKSRSFTWVRQMDAESPRSSYRCEFRVLADKHQRIIGYLMVFIDNSLEIDTLTGFPTKAVLQREAENMERVLEHPISTAVFDLNRLMLLNNTLGREMGDKAVRLLADNMRMICPDNTLFNRLDDANLLAVFPGTTASGARALTRQVAEHISKIDLGLGPLEVQSAIATVEDSRTRLLHAVSTATRSLRAQKMLDQDSAHSSLLDSLAQTLRECDGTTESHVQRTRIMGAMLGERLGLSDYEQSSLALLCLLHDIGKLGIPLDVLNKPGKLTDEEWDLMRSHVDKGYRIARASDELKDIAPFIRHHHECWDGNGYPDGLKHEAIPLLSRIIAVVDTYDAMINDRPYRVAIPKREACAELMRCAGTQFDPYLVSEFVNMLEETGQLDDEPRIDPATTAPISVRPRGLETYDALDQDHEALGPITFTEYVLDAQNRVVRIDEEFTKLTGYSQDDLGEGDHRLAQKDLIFPEDQERYQALVAHKLSQRQEAFIEHRIRRKDGSARYVFCLGRQYFDPVNQEPRAVIVAADIANTKALDVFVSRVKDSAQRNLDFWEQGARTDSLTNLLNHEAFKSDVRIILAGKQDQLLFAVIDVDHFKEYNDEFGHPSGDELLKKAALMLQASLPNTGIAGRLGGDEFALAVPLPPSASKEDAAKMADSIWRVINDSLNSGISTATVSMGAILAQPGSTFESVYEQADRALYESKKHGRNYLTVK